MAQQISTNASLRKEFDLEKRVTYSAIPTSVHEMDEIEAQKLSERVKYIMQETLEKLEELWTSTGITTFELKNLIFKNIFKVGLLHGLALYGLLYLPHMKWETAAWCMNNVKIFLLSLSSLYVSTLEKRITHSLDPEQRCQYYYAFSYLCVSGLSVTAGAHRLWCHRSYKARWPLRLFLMLANCCVAQNDLYDWVRDHRVHHKYSDTDADPHNITRGLFFSHVGWLFVKKHPQVTLKGAKIDCNDVRDDPIVAFQVRHYIALTLLFAFFIPTFVPVYCWGESVWVAFFIPTVLRLVIQLNVTWSVNSLAHYFGDKPFDESIWPTETKFVAFAAAGEGWHNYHHTFPHDYACSELGWYLNPTKLFIDLMWLVGLAYDCKQVTQETMDTVKARSGDGSRRPEKPPYAY